MSDKPKFDDVHCWGCSRWLPVKQCKLMQSEHNPSRVVWICQECRGLAPHLPGEAPVASREGDCTFRRVIRTEALPPDEQESFRLLQPVWPVKSGHEWPLPTVEGFAADTVIGFCLDVLINYLQNVEAASRSGIGIPLANVERVCVTLDVNVNGLTVLHLYNNWPPPGDEEDQTDG